MAFPALSALEAGYHDVFVVTDASGTFNEVTRHAAWTHGNGRGTVDELVRCGL